MNISEYINIRTALDNSKIKLPPAIEEKIKQLDKEYHNGDNAAKENACEELKKCLNKILKNRIEKGKTVRLSATTAKLQTIKDKFFPYYDAQGNLVIPGGKLNGIIDKIQKAINSKTVEEIGTTVLSFCLIKPVEAILSALTGQDVKLPPYVTMGIIRPVARIIVRSTQSLASLIVGLLKITTPQKQSHGTVREVEHKQESTVEY